jgi:muramoyltetrapeptide carboxypeptidase LdcA involved in peptidoglycan recycling
VKEFAERYAGDGLIWFLEACDLNPMGIRRAIWQLDQAGWFRNAKGFLIGRPLLFDEQMLGMDHYNAVTGVLEKYGVPIVMDTDLGHLPPMIPLISGALADVTASPKKLSVKMRLE